MRFGEGGRACTDDADHHFHKPANVLVVSRTKNEERGITYEVLSMGTRILRRSFMVCSPMQ